MRIKRLKIGTFILQTHIQLVVVLFGVQVLKKKICLDVLIKAFIINEGEGFATDIIHEQRYENIKSKITSDHLSDKKLLFLKQLR